MLQPRATVLCLILGTLLVGIAAPQAQAAPVPPGNSAADQYTETFPSAGGNQLSEPSAGGNQLSEPSAGGNQLSELSGGGGFARAQALGADTAREFTRAGPNGVAAATLAAETASASSVGGKGGDDGNGDARATIGEVAPQALANTGTSGMGLLFPAILIATLIFAAAITLEKRRPRKVR